MNCQRLLIGVTCVVSGCATERASIAHDNPDLAAHELRRLPKEVTGTLVDFGGKVKLVGYELGDGAPASAGKELPVTLFWQSTQVLEPGWELATHVVGDHGEHVTREVQGPLRGEGTSYAKVSPSAWRPGYFYRDEQRIKLPDEIDDEQLAIVVSVQRSVENAAPIRLPVLSGPSDGNEFGIVTRVPATISKKVVEAPRPERRRPPRRRDAAPPGASAAPAASTR